jgi:diadenosine tetraphosphate (Ap4A) HIT family hydrolase
MLPWQDNEPTRDAMDPIQHCVKGVCHVGQAQEYVRRMSANMSFKPEDFNWRHHRRMWRHLNAELNSIRRGSGFSAALNALWMQQLHAGIVVCDPRNVVRWRVCEEHGRGSYTVQWNPDRAKRNAAETRNRLPHGQAFVHDGCLLCGRNMYLRSCGLQLGYDLKLRHSNWVVFVNPYAFAPNHVVVATHAHEPQSWQHEAAERTACLLHGLLADLAEMAQMLPGWICMLNGREAGATVPQHAHMQCFARPHEVLRFALEEAAARVRKRVPANPVVVSTRDYPITTLLFHGSLEDVAEAATEWLMLWMGHHRNSDELTANFIATSDDSEMINLYVIPRSTAFAQAPGIRGLVGGLEVLGEIVISTEDERQSMDNARIDYAYVRKALACVEAPGIRRYLGIR